MMALLRQARSLGSEIKHIVQMDSFPPRTRFDLIGLSLRTRFDLIGLSLTKRFVLRGEWPIHIPPGFVYVGRSSASEDLYNFYDILWNGRYRGDYQGSTVIDVGAHRGYYGAYALWRGAKTVISFEPEIQNFHSLERAARSFRDRAMDWRTCNAAVGSSTRDATLHVSVKSDAHSLIDYGGLLTKGNQRVAVEPMADIIRGAQELGSKLIVKVDAEGSECDIVLGTSPEVWEKVSYLILEFHDFALCMREELIAHLGRAGLTPQRPISESTIHAYFCSEVVTRSE